MLLFQKRTLCLMVLIGGLFNLPSLFAGDCKEHVIQTDPVTMTANVNLDPYNRKDDPVASLWSVEREVYMEQSANGSKLFEHVPEGTYLFEYNGETCSVDVHLEVYIKAVEDQISVVLPCEGEYFSPVIFEVTDNDYYTCKYAIRNQSVSTENMEVELVEAPAFIHAEGARVIVDCPADTAEGDYTFVYRLKDQLGRYSNEVSASVLMTRYCPEPAPEKPVVKVLLDVPEIITPNGDGVYDELFIPGLDTLGRFRIDIYDRIGRKIWSNEDLLISWDGTRNGQPLPSQDYWYIIYLFDADTTFKGHVTLIR